MVDIDTAQRLLDEIAQELPEAFFTRLNGGISLLPDVRYNPRGRANDLYIMGDYHSGGAMGKYIQIYYGSMQAVFPHINEEQMKHQLREVLLHEFTHHLEIMAGEHGLELKDREQMRRYLNRE